MASSELHVRVLYSFPHKLGANRICTTAWHQIEGAAKAGSEITVLTGSICRPLPTSVKVYTTLSWHFMRLPYRLLGTLRACILHDWVVSQLIPYFADKIDIIHVWPLGALRTLKIARKLGIPTVLERPNAHTEYAYKVVRDECIKLGINMPAGHEHDFNQAILSREILEYDNSDYLLCPSDFVAQTFRAHGYHESKLLRHHYGYNEMLFYPVSTPTFTGKGLKVLFAGGCTPRKGLHYALDAWLQSTAHTDGTFLIAGAFIPGYAERLTKQLSHPSVKVLGHRTDIPDLMRQSDIFILPSIEEGSALVTSEARGCGCVLLVSEASGAICEHEINSLVHRVGDVSRLTCHINLLNSDRLLLARLRECSLSTANSITWTAAGKRLHSIYSQLK